MRKVVATLFLGSVLTGCSLDTTNRTLSVITSATNIAYTYENGQAVKFIDNAPLTDLEITMVLEAFDQIDRSKSVLKHYRDNPDALVLNIQDVSFQYAKIKSAYLSIREIVLSHKDAYNASEWAVFKEFDQSASVLDKEFRQLVEAVEANTALSTALRLADTAIKIGAML
jgi:hypothetical protein